MRLSPPPTHQVDVSYMLTLSDPIADPDKVSLSGRVGCRTLLSTSADVLLLILVRNDFQVFLYPTQSGRLDWVRRFAAVSSAAYAGRHNTDACMLRGRYLTFPVIGPLGWCSLLSGFIVDPPVVGRHGAVITFVVNKSVILRIKTFASEVERREYQTAP